VFLVAGSMELGVARMSCAGWATSELSVLGAVHRG
jgi:hypothetical protein